MPTDGIVRIKIEPLEQEPAIGLAAVGPLSDVHEASLFLDANRRNTDNLLLNASNLFHPQRIAFNDWLQNPAGGGGTVFSPTISSLWPVVPGDWLVGRLTNERDDTCGAVFWNEDVVGSTVERAAEVVRRDVCVEGNAGRYNVNKEPEAFERRGGRILGRYTWDSYCNGRCNNELKDDSARKLDMEELQRADWGPELMMVSASTYLEQVWPLIRREPAYGLKDEEGDAGGKGKLLSHGSTVMEGYASYGRVFLCQQEYLAGRVLTSVVSSKDGSSRRVAHLLLVFTYSAPEQLEDCGLEGLYIHGPKAIPLRKYDTFWSFLSNEETTEDDLLGAFESVSASKILNLLEFAILRNNSGSHSSEHRARTAHRVTSALYSSKNGIAKSAPTMEALFNTISECSDPLILDSMVLVLDKAQLLTGFIKTAQTNFDSSENPYYPHNPSLLLERASSLQGVEALTRAGIQLNVDSVSGNMSRLEMFQLLTDKLLRVGDSGQTNRDHLLAELSARAARGLHHGALEYTLNKLSVTGRKELFENRSFEIFGPLDPRCPPPHSKTPPVSKGTIGQNAAGKFFYQCYDYINYLERKRQSEERNQIAERQGTGESYHVAEREVYAGDDFMWTLKVMERFRTTGASLVSYYVPPDDFWEEFAYMKRFDNSPTEKLIEMAKDKFIALLETMSITKIPTV